MFSETQGNSAAASQSGPRGNSAAASQSGHHGNPSGAWSFPGTNENPYGYGLSLGASSSGTQGNSSNTSQGFPSGFAQGNSVYKSSSFQQRSSFNKKSANPHTSFGQLHAPPNHSSTSFGQLHAPPNHSSTSSAEVKTLKDEVKRLTGLLAKETAAVRTLKAEKDAADRLNRGLNRSKTMVEVYEHYRRQSEDRSYRPVGMKKYDSLELGDAVNNPNKQFTGTTRYGAVYKSTLDQKIVVIEIINSKDQQDFNQKVDILTRLQHPNLVSYIGSYKNQCALIYEHLSGDTLQDRLVTKSPTTPFSWEERVGIAASICSTLLFLHNTKFSPIIHGDLKAENICFDADNMCRLSVFGLSRSTQPTSNNKIMVPSIQSDICAFGIVLL